MPSSRVARLMVLAAILCGGGRAFGAADAGRLENAAARRGLAKTAAWRSLLLYVPRMTGGESSVVDAPGFFLSPRGKQDPDAELQATLRAFLQPLSSGQDADKHALCRYPARRAFLTRELPELAAALPKTTCKALGAWLAHFDVHAVSLVFASYYINNPASLFGHTFLRLHRRPDAPGEPEPPAMLDYTVNFAANPTTYNALLYPLLGVGGGFPGTFSLMPYYMQVQEYNNAESRDLWEYELSFDEAETRSLMSVLWELAPHYIDYFYVDENCSFIMLLLLDAVRPSLALGSRFPFLVTPADTLRVATQASGLVRGVSLRASSLTRFEMREKALTQDELALLKAVFRAEEAGEPAPSLTGLSEAGRIRVLDAALDWIDFKEELSGSKQAGRYKALQDRLLAARARLPASQPPPSTADAEARPDLGPKSIQASLGGGRDGRGRGFLETGLRPTLHTLESPSLGYSNNLQIEMMHLTVRENLTGEHRFRLQSLRVFDALSLPSVRPLMTPLAWRFGIGAERDAFYTDGLMRYVEGGSGLAWAGGPVTLYGLASARVGLADQVAGHVYAEPALTGGILVQPIPTLMLSAEAAANRQLGHDEARAGGSLRVQGTLQVKPWCELKLYGERFDERLEAGAQASVFF